MTKLICQTEGATCTASRHTFQHHSIASYSKLATLTDQQYVCVILPKTNSYSGLFLESVWYPQVLKWSVLKWLWWDLTDTQPAVAKSPPSWLAGSVNYRFGFIWNSQSTRRPHAVEVIWQCQLSFESKETRHFIAGCLSPPHAYRSGWSNAGPDHEANYLKHSKQS